MPPTAAGADSVRPPKGTTPLHVTCPPCSTAPPSPGRMPTAPPATLVAGGWDLRRPPGPPQEMTAPAGPGILQNSIAGESTGRWSGVANARYYELMAAPVAGAALTIDEPVTITSTRTRCPLPVVPPGSLLPICVRAVGSRGTGPFCDPLTVRVNRMLTRMARASVSVVSNNHKSRSSRGESGPSMFPALTMPELSRRESVSRRRYRWRGSISSSIFAYHRTSPKPAATPPNFPVMNLLLTLFRRHRRTAGRCRGEASARTAPRRSLRPARYGPAPAGADHRPPDRSEI